MYRQGGLCRDSILKDVGDRVCETCTSLDGAIVLPERDGVCRDGRRMEGGEKGMRRRR